MDEYYVWGRFALASAESSKFPQAKKARTGHDYLLNEYCDRLSLLVRITKRLQSFAQCPQLVDGSFIEVMK